MIPRPGLVTKLESYKDRNVIKAVTGVRRCGKSVLLRMYRDRLAELGVPPERVVSVDLDLLENEVYSSMEKSTFRSAGFRHFAPERRHLP